MRLKHEERWELSEIFKSKRIEAELSQSKLAKLVGTKESTISGIETGKTIPRNTTIRQLAEFYDFSEEETQRCIDIATKNRKNRENLNLFYIMKRSEQILDKVGNKR